MVRPRAFPRPSKVGELTRQGPLSTEDPGSASRKLFFRARKRGAGNDGACVEVSQRLEKDRSPCEDVSPNRGDPKSGG